jgi:hypothetical protein
MARQRIYEVRTGHSAHRVCMSAGSMSGVGERLMSRKGRGGRSHMIFLGAPLHPTPPGEAFFRSARSPGQPITRLLRCASAVWVCSTSSTCPIHLHHSPSLTSLASHCCPKSSPPPARVATQALALFHLSSILRPSVAIATTINPSTSIATRPLIACAAACPLPCPRCRGAGFADAARPLEGRPQRIASASNVPPHPRTLNR